jgi:glycyl-tRNA synthetase (class II)
MNSAINPTQQTPPLLGAPVERISKSLRRVLRLPGSSPVKKIILPLLSRKPLEETREDGFDRMESHGVTTKKNSRKSGPRSITDLVLLVHS